MCVCVCVCVCVCACVSRFAAKSLVSEPLCARCFACVTQIVSIGELSCASDSNRARVNLVGDERPRYVLRALLLEHVAVQMQDLIAHRQCSALQRSHSAEIPNPDIPPRILHTLNTFNRDTHAAANPATFRSES